MKLKKITLGGKTFEVNEDVADAIVAAHADSVKAEQEKAAAADAKVAEVTKEKDTLQAKHDGLASDLEKAKKAHADAAGVDVKALVKERMRLETAARITLDSEAVAKLDEMSDLEIKKAVILADSKDAKLDDKSDAYISARFDSIQEKLDSDDAEAERIAASMRQGVKGTETKVDAADARAKAMEKAKNMWKEPLSATATNK